MTSTNNASLADTFIFTAAAMDPPSAAVMALEQCSLQVEIWIDPANVEKFFEAFQKIFDIVSAEPECTFFEVFQDPDDLGHLSWVENWSASTVWVATVQLQKEYYKPYLAETEPLFLKPRQFRILKRFGGSLVVQKETNLKKV